jgi:hypothetical protein
MIYSSKFYDGHKDYDVRLGILRQTWVMVDSSNVSDKKKGYNILLECLRQNKGYNILLDVLRQTQGL